MPPKFNILLCGLTVTLVLHPCHKLQYFKDAGWEDEWITWAKTIVHKEFDWSYASLDADWASPVPLKVWLIIFLEYSNDKLKLYR
jgi:hypothetical protein